MVELIEPVAVLQYSAKHSLVITLRSGQQRSRLNVLEIRWTHEEEESRQTSGVDSNLQRATPTKDVAHDED